MTPSQRGLLSRLGETVVSVVHFAKQYPVLKASWKSCQKCNYQINLRIRMKALNSSSVSEPSIKMQSLRAKPCSLFPFSSNLNPLDKYSPCKIQLTVWIISKCLLPSKTSQLEFRALYCFNLYSLYHGSLTRKMFKLSFIPQIQALYHAQSKAIIFVQKNWGTKVKFIDHLFFPCTIQSS